MKVAIVIILSLISLCVFGASPTLTGTNIWTGPNNFTNALNAFVGDGFKLTNLPTNGINAIFFTNLPSASQPFNTTNNGIVTAWIPTNSLSTNFVAANFGQAFFTNPPITIGPAWTIVNLNPVLATATWEGAPTSKGGKLTITTTATTQVAMTNYFAFNPPLGITRTNEMLMILTPLASSQVPANVQRFWPATTNIWNSYYLSTVNAAPAVSTTYKTYVSFEGQ